MTDEPTITPADKDGAQKPEQPSAPTPEERIAETTADDPEVGSDGTGLGELP